MEDGAKAADSKAKLAQSRNDKALLRPNIFDLLERSSVMLDLRKDFDMEESTALPPARAVPACS